jgi:DNA-binding IscR family transcriptional regulator
MMTVKEKLLEELLDSIYAELYRSEWEETEKRMREVLEEYTVEQSTNDQELREMDEVISCYEVELSNGSHVYRRH